MFLAPPPKYKTFEKFGEKVWEKFRNRIWEEGVGQKAAVKVCLKSIQHYSVKKHRVK